MNFMSKKVKVSLFATLVMLLFTSLLLSGCSENFAAVFGNTEKANTQEKLRKNWKKKKKNKENWKKNKNKEKGIKRAGPKRRIGSIFCTPSPLEQEDNPPVKARGIYLTEILWAWKQVFPIVRPVENTELNAMVIDVKNDHGLVTYPSQIEIVQQVKADKAPPIKDMKAVLAELKREIFTLLLG